MITAPQLLGLGVAFNGAAFFLLAVPAAWAVKVVGYFVLARWLCPKYPEVEISPSIFAVVRAFLGVLVGLVYYALAFPEPTFWHADPSPLPWYGTLTWLRFLEWVAILWLFFGRHIGRRATWRILGHSAVGTVWSVALDFVVGAVLVPAIVVALISG
jgi:hypothetical protein